MSISIVFPGQGSQYIGMGERIVREYPIANKIFEEANDILKMDLKDYCFGIHTNKLINTQYTQLAVYVVSYAVYAILKEQIGIIPNIMAGHSLGELTALASANVFSFADGVKIVQKRGELMQQVAADDYKMAAILGDNLANLLTICNEVSTDKEIVEISNFNANYQQVISGHKAAVEKVVDMMKDRGQKAIFLNVNSPFHSSIMQEPARLFREYLESFSFNKPNVHVLSNVTGREHDYTILPQMLSRQIVEPVNWIACMDYMNRYAIYHVIEMGPGATLLNMLKSHLTKAKLYSVGELLEYERINQQLKTLKPLYRFIQKCLSIAITTQNQGNQTQEKLQEIVKAYKNIELLHHRMKEGAVLTNDEIGYVVQSLKKILEIKKISKDEWSVRFKELNHIVAADDSLKNHLLTLIGE